MNIFSKLTIKSLKANRVRTIITIIGITLSVMIINSTLMLSNSFKEQSVKKAAWKYGTWEISISAVNQADKDYIMNEFAPINIGYAYNHGIFVDNGQRLAVVGLNKEAFSMLGVEIIEGRLPQNEFEVVISEPLMEITTQYKLGDTLSKRLYKSYCESIITGELINANNEPFNVCDSGSLIDIEDAESSQYTIVGIMSNPKFSIYNYYDNNGSSTIYMNVKDWTKFDRMGNVTSPYSGEGYNITINDDYLYWNAGSSGSLVLYGITTLAVFIFLSCSLLMIYNAFTISFAQRKRQYGIISSTGATSKQIMQSVLAEGFIVWIIGMVAGMIISYVFFHSLSSMINAYLQAKEWGYYPLHFVNNPISILITAVLTLLAVLGACYLPCVKAMDKSSISIIRENKDQDYHINQFKLPAWMNKFYGFELKLAIKNSKRTKKRNRSITLSITVSIILFVVAQSFLYYEALGRKTVLQEAEYDVSIYGDFSNVPDALVKEAFISLSTASNVTGGIMQRGIMVTLDKFPLNIIDEEVAQDWNFSKLYYDETTTMTATIIAIDNKDFEKYAKSLGLDYRLYSDIDNPKIILHGREDALNQETNTYGNRPLFSETYCAELKAYNFGNNGNEFVNEEIFTFKNITLVDKQPELVHIPTSQSLAFIVPESIMDYFTPLQKFTTYYGYQYQWSEYTMNFSSSDKDKTLESMKTIAASIDFIDEGKISAYTAYEDVALQMISYVIMAFAIVIVLIAITNVVNITYSSIDIRRKEIAMLTSIGMKRKQISKMVIYEYMYLIMKGIILAIPLCILITMRIRNGMIGIVYLDYKYPIDDIATGSLLFAILVVIISSISLRALNAKNVVESIKDDNT